jgi:hypothetical protein
MSQAIIPPFDSCFFPIIRRMFVINGFIRLCGENFWQQFWQRMMKKFSFCVIFQTGDAGVCHPLFENPE